MENGNIVEVCFQYCFVITSTANSWDCCDLLEINDRMIIGSNLQYHILACMVLQDGKHSELIEKNGLYSRLAKRQNDNLDSS